LPFNALDLALGAMMVAAGLAGWRLGLVTRALSWAGLAGGVVLAARLLPRIARSADASTGRAELALIGIGLLLAGAFLGQAIGLVAGSRLRVGVRGERARQIDSVGGAVAGVLGVLVAVWLVVPALADVPGTAARQARGSRIARVVAEVFPPAPDATRTLRRLLGEGYPRVFDSLRPTPASGPPPRVSGIDPATSARAAAATVKVVGEACGRIQEGTGFVARAGLVVTNAHVVSGEPRTTLERSDGVQVDALVVAFDPARDIAVLSAPDLDRPALPLGEVESGARGAVYGHPGGGPLEASPFRVDRRIRAVGRDIYGAARTERDVLVLAADLEPGDSGSALVAPDGQVIGVAFAIAPDRPGVAYALTPAEIRAVLARVPPAATAAATGPCIT
jgi:S1-C subfamily serine protease